jgi:hypothetical protein
MVIRRRASTLLLVLGVSAAGVGSAAVLHQLRYGVPLFAPDAFPKRVDICGRSFRASDHSEVTNRRAVDARYPGLEPLERIGDFHPPLHASMEILGHPRSPACGVVIFVGVDDDHLTAFALMGGP